MSKETGGPAFPVTPTDKSGQIAPTFEGMTLRDYFAAKAAPVVWAAVDKDMTANNAARIAAETAYCIADAMLAERDK